MGIRIYLFQNSPVHSSTRIFSLLHENLCARPSCFCYHSFTLVQITQLAYCCLMEHRSTRPLQLQYLSGAVSFRRGGRAHALVLAYKLVHFFYNTYIIYLFLPVSGVSSKSLYFSTRERTLDKELLTGRSDLSLVLLSYFLRSSQQNQPSGGGLLWWPLLSSTLMLSPSPSTISCKMIGILSNTFWIVSTGKWSHAWLTLFTDKWRLKLTWRW